jgi:Holliday junction resolvasome RuvABC DNA-binding subunit
MFGHRRTAFSVLILAEIHGIGPSLALNLIAECCTDLPR